MGGLKGYVVSLGSGGGITETSFTEFNKGNVVNSSEITGVTTPHILGLPLLLQITQLVSTGSQMCLLYGFMTNLILFCLFWVCEGSRQNSYRA